MNTTHGATAYDVAVALLLAINTAIVAWSTWHATLQRSRIERKVDEAKETATARANGTYTDDA